MPTTPQPKSCVSLHTIASFYLTIAIPLLYFGNLLVIARSRQTMSLPLRVVVFGVILSFLGIAVWIVSLLHLGRSFGVLPRHQPRIKRGIYKYMRHPMYLGISLTFIGLSLANKAKLGLGFTILILLPLLAIRAYLEERQLTTEAS